MTTTKKNLCRILIASNLAIFLATVACLNGGSEGTGVVVAVPPRHLQQACCACTENNGSSPTTAPLLQATQELRDAVDVNNILNHLDALLTIADESDGNRAALTIGYDRSARYVLETLQRETDFRVVQQNLTMGASCQFNGDATLSNSSGAYVYGTDFWDAWCNPLASGEGLTQRVGSFGCAPEDFDSFVEGNIAVIPFTDDCEIDEQVILAELAGAVGAIIYNDQSELFVYTLEDLEIAIPVFTVSFQFGADLLQNPRVLYMETQSAIIKEITSNIIAESIDGDENHVIIAGAHLDSVEDGPGINDNGSGSSMLLEIAIQMSKLPKDRRNKVRFAWWGAEEICFCGSFHYIDTLTQVERDNIDIYLNFDMVASLNYVRAVYPPLNPKEQLAAEIWHDYFDASGEAVLPLDDARVAEQVSGRSDQYEFQFVNITSSGLYTGFDLNKTQEEFAIFGGALGEVSDPCYHRVCDRVTNINLALLDELADAAAYGILTFADRDNSDIRDAE